MRRQLFRGRHPVKMGASPEVAHARRQLARWEALAYAANTQPGVRLALWQRLLQCTDSQPCPPPTRDAYLLAQVLHAKEELKRGQDRRRQEAIQAWRARLSDGACGHKAMWQWLR